jgi:hypothetical protein
MEIITSEQSTANKEYLRRLLRQRQPGFSAALELAVDLLRQELHRAETPRDIGAREGACPVAPRRCQRRRTLPRSSRPFQLCR